MCSVKCAVPCVKADEAASLQLSWLAATAQGQHDLLHITTQHFTSLAPKHTARVYMNHLVSK